MSRRVILALTAALLLAPLPGGLASRAAAQDAPDTTSGRERIEQRVRAAMGRMIRDRLDLDSAQAERLSEVVESFDEERRALFREEEAVRREVEAAQRTPPPEDSARALLDRMADLRMREAELFREEQAALLGVLRARQVLELQSLREEIGRRIRILRLRDDRDGPRERRRFRPGPRPGGLMGAGFRHGRIVPLG